MTMLSAVRTLSVALGMTPALIFAQASDLPNFEDGAISQLTPQSSTLPRKLRFDERSITIDATRNDQIRQSGVKFRASGHYAPSSQYALTFAGNIEGLTQSTQGDALRVDFSSLYLTTNLNAENTLRVGRLTTRHTSALGYSPTDFAAPRYYSNFQRQLSILQSNQRPGILAIEHSLTTAKNTFTSVLIARHTASSLFKLASNNPTSVALLTTTSGNLANISYNASAYFTKSSSEFGLNSIYQFSNVDAVMYGEYASRLSTLEPSEAEQHKRYDMASLGVRRGIGAHVNFIGEWHHNDAAPTSSQWQRFQRLISLGLTPTSSELSAITGRPARDELLVGATWRGLPATGFDGTITLSHEFASSSNLVQLGVFYAHSEFQFVFEILKAVGEPTSIYKFSNPHSLVRLGVKSYF